MDCGVVFGSAVMLVLVMMMTIIMMMMRRRMVPRPVRYVVKSKLTLEGLSPKQQLVFATP